MRVTLKQMGTVFEDLHYGSNLGGSNALFDRSDILFQNKGDLSINKKKAKNNQDSPIRGLAATQEILDKGIRAGG